MCEGCWHGGHGSSTGSGKVKCLAVGDQTKTAQLVRVQWNVVNAGTSTCSLPHRQEERDVGQILQGLAEVLQAVFACIHLEIIAGGLTWGRRREENRRLAWRTQDQMVTPCTAMLRRPHRNPKTMSCLHLQILTNTCRMHCGFKGSDQGQPVLCEFKACGSASRSPNMFQSD